MGSTRRVRIVATRNVANTPHGVDFEMLEEGSTHPTNTLSFNKRTDGMWKFQNYKILFSLENRNGSDLRFLKDEDEVMWVSQGLPGQDPPCPTSSGNHSGQGSDKEFDVKDIENDRLEVKNKDKTDLRYSFRLNFIGTNAAGETALIPYDPIYDNRDGGYTLFS